MDEGGRHDAHFIAVVVDIVRGLRYAVRPFSTHVFVFRETSFHLQSSFS
jgi:hypothetical protein